jgi:hypothetical protein
VILKRRRFSKMLSIITYLPTDNYQTILKREELLITSNKRCICKEQTSKQLKEAFLIKKTSKALQFK